MKKPSSVRPAAMPGSSICRARRRRIALAAGLVAVVGLGAWFALAASARRPTIRPPPAPQATPVSVAVVEQRDVVIWDEFSGRLEAIERVEVRSRVAGAVQAVHFREGALVKQDDLLITIDPAPYAAEVERAEAQVAAAEARVALTKNDLERGRAAVRTRASCRSAISTSASTRIARPRPICAARRPRCRPRAQSRLHPSARAGRRPRRQARDHRRQSGRGRSGRAGADDAGFGRSDLCELQCRRAGGDARAARRSAPSGRARAGRAHPGPDEHGTSNGTPFAGPAAIDRQPGRCAQRHGAGARGVRQSRRQSDAGPVRAAAHGPGEDRAGVAGQRARDRHRPEQEVRAGRR